MVSDTFFCEIFHKQKMERNRILRLLLKIPIETRLNPLKSDCMELNSDSGSTSEDFPR
jgi:hypothetical protein